MTSVLKVDTIQSSGGTTGLTIDSGGRIAMAATTMYDVYRLTTDATANGTLTAWESPDDALAVTIGDSMSVSSGIFTFPRTGVYKVTLYANIENSDGDAATAIEVMGTTDNSSYDALAFLQVTSNDSSALVRATTSGECIVNISDTSNRKIELTSVSDTSAVKGSTNRNESYVTFQYLAPAQ